MFTNVFKILLKMCYDYNTDIFLIIRGSIVYRRVIYNTYRIRTQGPNSVLNNSDMRMVFDTVILSGLRSKIRGSE